MRLYDPEKFCKAGFKSYKWQHFSYLPILQPYPQRKHPSHFLSTFQPITLGEPISNFLEKVSFFSPWLIFFLSVTHYSKIEIISCFCLSNSAATLWLSEFSKSLFICSSIYSFRFFSSSSLAYLSVIGWVSNLQAAPNLMFLVSQNRSR